MSVSQARCSRKIDGFIIRVCVRCWQLETWKNVKEESLTGNLQDWGTRLIEKKKLNYRKSNTSLYPYLRIPDDSNPYWSLCLLFAVPSHLMHCQLSLPIQQVLNHLLVILEHLPACIHFLNHRCKRPSLTINGLSRSKFETVKSCSVQTPGYSMNINAPDASEQEGSGTKALPMKPAAAILGIPHNQDTLKILCSKLTAIASVISAGQSVAVATGYSAAANPEQRAVEKAVGQMDPWEHRAWEWFQTGSYVLPEMDWKSNVDSIPQSLRPLKTAQRRAEALNRLYKTDQAKPCHSVWFTKHHLLCLPLVKAMARVIGAERDLVGGGVWTATQLADLQSINKILSVTSQIVSGHASDPLLPAIARALAVLASHRDTLRNLIVGRKRKRGT